MATYAESATESMAVTTAEPAFTFPKEVTEGFDIADPSSLIALIIESSTESFAGSDVVVANATISNSIVESGAFSDTGAMALLVVESVSETGGMIDSASATAIFNINVMESMLGGTSFIISGNVYEAFSINSNTGAHSRYDGYNFNSFAKFDGKFWGCGRDGLYVLDGSDDEGEKISAYLSTGLIDLGNGFQTRISNAYAVIRNDGPMEFRLVGDDGQMYSYRMTNENERLGASRVKVGKGVKSALWQFELANVDGSDFDVANLRIIPMVLSRRI
jgi:hypothetical protein